MNMELRFEQFNESPVYFFRRCGYHFQGEERGEWSFVMRLSGGDFPRFHIYAKMDGDDLLLNLHLDQKRPSYEGSHAHAGEYEGPGIIEEGMRIKAFHRPEYENKNKAFR